MRDGTGTLYRFLWEESENAFISQIGKYVRLRKEEGTETVTIPESGGDRNIEVSYSYVLSTKDGDDYYFSVNGLLVLLREPNENFILFEHDSVYGRLEKLTTARNISVEFRYENPSNPLLISEISFPDGGCCEYTYDSAGSLTSMTKRGAGDDCLEYEYGYGGAGARKKLTEITDSGGNSYEISYTGEKVSEFRYPNPGRGCSESIQMEYDDETYTEDGFETSGRTVTVTRKIAGGEVVSTDSDAINYNGGTRVYTDSEGLTTTYIYRDHLIWKKTSEVDYGEIRNNTVVSLKGTVTEETEYTDDENVESETDETGSKSSYRYENIDEIAEDMPSSLKEVDGDGNCDTMEYYTYDSDGNLVLVYDQITDTSIYTEYDDYGEIIAEVEMEGRAELDSDSKITADSISDAEVSTDFSYSYGEDGTKTETTTENSESGITETVKTFDAMGRTVSMEISSYGCRADYASKSNRVEYYHEEITLDDFGRVTSTDITEGTGESAKTSHTSASYNPDGTLASETAADGTVKSYSYDCLGKVTSENVAKGTDSKTTTTEYGYEDITICTGTGTKNYDNAFTSTERCAGSLVEKTYQDGFGNVIREQKNGIICDMTYDGQGNMLTKCERGIGASADEPYVVEVYVYDIQGNLIATLKNPDVAEESFVINDESTIATRDSYDSAGNVTESVDGNGVVSEYSYDEQGRIIHAGYRGKENYSTDIRYEDEYTACTSAGGLTSKTYTDELDREIRIVDSAAGCIPIERDIVYDAAGRIESESSSGGNSVTYSYDVKGRKSSEIYKEGDDSRLKTEYVYDDSDNIISMSDYSFENGGWNLYSVAKMEYDGFGRMTGYAQLGESELSGEITESLIEVHMIHYGYDVDDNLTSVTYPQAVDESIDGLGYVYDVNNRLMEIDAVIGNDTAVLREYTYMADGKVETIRDYRNFMNDDRNVYTLMTFEYDSFDRATSITYTESGESDVRELHEYTYDRNSNILSERILNSYDPASANEEEDISVDEIRRFIYDDFGQITQESVTETLEGGEKSTRITEYSYDIAGNRTEEEEEDGKTTYRYNGLNQLMSSVKKAEDDENEIIESRSYSYDRDGNQTSESVNSGEEIRNYSYDAAGRLSHASVTNNGSVVAEQRNQYDGSGRRIVKSENGKRTDYRYDSDHVLYTVSSSDESTMLESEIAFGDDEEGEDEEEPEPYMSSFNLYGIDDNIIAGGRTDDGNEEYFFYNRNMQGSTTNIIDMDGDSVCSYTYDAFGETEKTCGEEFYNELCYTGGIYDETTGLYYLNARYYNPEDGRFLTEDTYRGEYSSPESLHLYAYCQNNPVTYTDPSGHFPVWAVIGAAMGAHSGYKYAKKKKYTGIKKAACIVGGAALGAVNPFKAGKAVKSARRASKILHKSKSSKAIVKKTKKVAKKKARVKTKNVKKKTARAAQKAKCKATEKGCFTADTLVSTEKGEVPIEEIEAGDLVWSEDVNTGEIELKEVERVLVHYADEILHIYTEDGGEIETTPMHVFYVENVGFIPADYLEEGSVLKFQSGDTVAVVKTSLEQIDSPILVYNLEVEEFHTYFVSEKSIFVHNMCANAKSEKHHIASDKSYASGYTAKYKKIFDRAGMKMSDPLNIIELENHSGAHTKVYKDYVLDYLNRNVGNATGKEAKGKLTKALKELSKELKENPRMPYKGGM